MKNIAIRFAGLFALCALGLNPITSHALCAIGYGGTIADAVTAVGNQYVYSYTVSGAKQFSCATPGDVTSFSVPYFDDAGITGITSPTGWSFNISSADTFALGHGAQTLTWSASAGYGIAPQLIVSSYFDPITQAIVFVYSPQVLLGGFGFTAAFAPVKAPYQVTGTNFTGIGDPALPGSPNAQAAGLTSPLPLTVPEPDSALLALAGLAMLLGASARKTRGAAA